MSARLLTANTIRNAALDVIDRTGIDCITTAGKRGRLIRIPTKSATVNGLKISYRQLLYGRDLLEIWDGPKVFNVQGDANGRLNIVSFRRGAWERNSTRLHLNRSTMRSLRRIFDHLPSPNSRS
ncbi:hypothetical protein JJB99_01800 [Bradyrhizobium diazoefficiens]|uniref:hypothetical protein n=1 Tax=Bradyrhizobium diazoefficiens TaxID=1355477 RepID=UPI00190D06AD|nr:hypothetical protein [Bradyrhizobium diazoefficiens]QQO14952.1 hypothetical protein JJB99_01800 [Bradyrhizobium diazoefficiens]